MDLDQVCRWTPTLQLALERQAALRTAAQNTYVVAKHGRVIRDGRPTMVYGVCDGANFGSLLDMRDEAGSSPGLYAVLQPTQHFGESLSIAYPFFDFDRCVVEPDELCRCVHAAGFYGVSCYVTSARGRHVHCAGPIMTWTALQRHAREMGADPAVYTMHHLLRLPGSAKLGGEPKRYVTGEPLPPHILGLRPLPMFERIHPVDIAHFIARAMLADKRAFVSPLYNPGASPLPCGYCALCRKHHRHHATTLRWWRNPDGQSWRLSCWKRRLSDGNCRQQETWNIRIETHAVRCGAPEMCPLM